eukprot:Hpha_TRINITY_DN15935_c2_g4::TRINITY_DN15935_c2_g4_i1::g.71541::m.71541
MRRPAVPRAASVGTPQDLQAVGRQLRIPPSEPSPEVNPGLALVGHRLEEEYQRSRTSTPVSPPSSRRPSVPQHSLPLSKGPTLRSAPFGPLPSTAQAAVTQTTAIRRAKILQSAYADVELSPELVGELGMLGEEHVHSINARLRLDAATSQVEEHNQARVSAAAERRQLAAAAATDRLMSHSRRRVYAAESRHLARRSSVPTSSTGPTPQAQRRAIQEQLREGELQMRIFERAAREVEKARTEALSEQVSALRRQIDLVQSPLVERA